MEVKALILPSSDFLLAKMSSSSASSPSMMAQLSGAGSSLSLAAAFITSLEYLYSSLGTPGPPSAPGGEGGGPHVLLLHPLEAPTHFWFFFQK